MSEAPAPFKLLPASDDTPLVASIPHTGNYIPPEFEARLASDAMRLQPMTDWHLHHLYDFLPGLGVTVIHATWSRFVADLNRPPEPRELYPGRFETGIVPTETFWGDTVWAEPPTEDEIARLKDAVHRPYHERLSALLDDTVARHGHAVLVDCHSVRSAASKLHGELEHEIYLGDRDGAACGDWLMETVAEGFSSRGLSVSRNHPYKGGFITDEYGSREGVDAIQIEMCQRVYMEEDEPATAVGSGRFLEAQTLLRGLWEELLAEVLRRSHSKV